MKKHSISIILVIALILCFCCGAFAAERNATIKKKTKIYRLATTKSQSMTVPKGLAVKVVDYANGWCKIKRGKATAFIQAKYLSAAGASKIDKVLLTAMNQVGKRYGRNPPSKFDCSALVQYSFGKHGYKVKGTAAAIARDGRYPAVPKNKMIKGDIICFDANNDARCDHVGIYIGKGYMIEASYTAGIVRVKKLNSWYKNHIMFARRVS